VSEVASKLTEYAYAIEQTKRTEEALNFLRQILGTYECERNGTVKFLEGYASAMKRIIYQSEL
jgi:hypothetical protein